MVRGKRIVDKEERKEMAGEKRPSNLNGDILLTQEFYEKDKKEKKVAEGTKEIRDAWRVLSKRKRDENDHDAISFWDDKMVNKRVELEKQGRGGLLHGSKGEVGHGCTMHTYEKRLNNVEIRKTFFKLVVMVGEELVALENRLKMKTIVKKRKKRVRAKRVKMMRMKKMRRKMPVRKLQIWIAWKTMRKRMS